MAATQPQSSTPQAAQPAHNKPDQADVYSFLDLSNLNHLPCFRDSALWAIGTATTLGLFQYARVRSPLSMLNYAAVGAAVSGGGSYMLCRSQHIRQRDTVRFYMQNQDELKRYVQQQKLDADRSGEVQTQIIQPEVVDRPEQSNATQIR